MRYDSRLKAFLTVSFYTYFVNLSSDVPTYDCVSMVLMLNGNSENVTKAWRRLGLFGEKNPICDSSRSNQMP